MPLLVRQVGLSCQLWERNGCGARVLFQRWWFAEGFNSFQLAGDSVSLCHWVMEGKPSKPALLCGSLCALHYGRTELKLPPFFFCCYFKSCHEVVWEECINIFARVAEKAFPWQNSASGTVVNSLLSPFFTEALVRNVQIHLFLLLFSHMFTL